MDGYNRDILSNIDGILISILKGLDELNRKIDLLMDAALEEESYDGPDEKKIRLDCSSDYLR